MSVTKHHLRRSIDRLADALNQPKNEFIRDSVIQRFEFCVELAWKTSKKIMGTSISAPKEVVREMAQNQYITDVEEWLVAIDMLNLSAHTYNEEIAEKVYAFAEAFLPTLEQLWQVLEVK